MFKPKVISFDEASAAFTQALLDKNFSALDRILETNPNALVKCRNSKLPLFLAVEKTFSENADLLGDERHEYLAFITSNLDAVLNKCKKRFGGDLGANFASQACNHISHSAWHDKGIALLDLLYIYTMGNKEIPYRESIRATTLAFKEIDKLAATYGMMSRDAIASEN